MILELLLAAIAGALWVLALGFRRWGLLGPKGKVIEAETFVVRDATGTVRATFGLLTPSLPPALRIYNANKAETFVVGRREIGPIPEHLVYLGEEGLAIHDSDGAYRIGLVLDQRRRVVRLILKDNESRAHAELMMAGPYPWLGLSDREERSRVHVGFVRGDEFGFVLHDKQQQGKVLWSVSDDSVRQEQILRDIKEGRWTPPDTSPPP